MKNTFILATAAAVLTSFPALAAKPKIPGTGKNTQQHHDEPAAKYDTNNNGRIDGDEIEAIMKAFAADPTGPLKKYDTNHDGKLERGEVVAIHFAPKKGK